jgi:hypothetical protein
MTTLTFKWHMRLIPVIMPMAIGSVALGAQPPTAGASPTRDVGGDPIVSISLKSEFPSFNMENALNHEMPIFDLTKVSVLEENGNARVARAGNSIYFERISERDYAYEISNDSISLAGWSIGNRAAMVFSDRQPMFSVNMSKGTTTCGKLCANGAYDVDNAIYESGDFECESLGKCRFIYSVNDTLNNVLLTRELRRSTIGFSGLSGDYIADEEPSFTEVSTTYRWFAEGSKLPFAVQYDSYLTGSNGGHSDDINVLCVANNSDMAEYIADSDEDTVKDDIDIASILSALKVSYSGGDILLSIPSEANDMMVDVYVMDSCGNIYNHVNFDSAADKSSIEISTSGLRFGSYIVSVVFDNNAAYNEKRLISIA